jgi:hypothetical protein
MASWNLTGNDPTTSEFLGTLHNEPLVIKTANTERLRIDTNGNVGIGTNVPQSVLQIKTLTALNEGATTAGAWANFGSNSYYDGAWKRVDGARAGVNFHMNADDGVGQEFRFQRAEANGNTRNLAVLGSTTSFILEGNLGVGTTSPIAKLDVMNNGGSEPSPFVLHVQQDSNTGVGTDSNALLRFSHFNGSNSRHWTMGTGSNTLFGHPDNFGINDTVSGTALVVNVVGNVGIGTNNPVSKLHVRGDITVTGGDVLLTDSADCAEHFDSVGQRPEPGTVMVIGAAGALRQSDEPYDSRVAGVVSGAGEYRHGLVLDKRSSEESRIPIALIGKVYCKVDANCSPIEVGDLLTTSWTPGCAMKAMNRERAYGAVLGKALEPLRNGFGLIKVLIALH